MKTSIQIYITDVGTIILPDDFPGYACRKDGAPDKRRSIARDLARYIEDINEGAIKLWQRGSEVHGQRAMSWAEWRS